LGGGHDGSGSGDYILLNNVPDAPGQHDWRWCSACQGLFFASNSTGICPSGGGHDGSGSGDYILLNNVPDAPGQHGWRWCSACQGLFFADNSAGICPSGGEHDGSGSGDYSLALGAGDPLGPAGFGSGKGGSTGKTTSQPPRVEDDLKGSWCIPHQGVDDALIGQVFFSTDSDFLDANDTNALNHLIEALSELPSFLPGADPVRILFRGHADPRGGEQHNADLSSRRAMEAQGYVVRSLPPGDPRFETDTRAKGALKEVPLFGSLAYERRVDIFSVGGPIGKPVPPPTDIETQRRRIVGILNGPMFFFPEVRNRLLCIFDPQIKKFDQYLFPTDTELFKALMSPGRQRMSPADVGALLNRHTVRKEIMTLVYSPAFDDKVIVQALTYLDVNILSGIALVDRADKLGELNVNRPFAKQMLELIVDSQANPESLYSCYR